MEYGNKWDNDLCIKLEEIRTKLKDIRRKPMFLTEAETQAHAQKTLRKDSIREVNKNDQGN